MSRDVQLDGSAPKIPAARWAYGFRGDTRRRSHILSASVACADWGKATRTSSWLRFYGVPRPDLAFRVPARSLCSRVPSAGAGCRSSRTKRTMRIRAPRWSTTVRRPWPNVRVGGNMEDGRIWEFHASAPCRAASAKSLAQARQPLPRIRKSATPYGAPFQVR